MSNADFVKAHQSSDTDFEQTSMHHTLGNGPTQGAPGNHGHADLSSELGTLDTRVDAAELALTALENADIALDARVDTLETTATAYDTRLDTLEATDIAYDTRLDNLESADTALDARLDDLEVIDAPTTNTGGSYTTLAGTQVFVYPTGLAESTFVAPASGRMLIMYFAYVRGSADGILAGVSIEVAEGATIRSGTVVKAAVTLDMLGNANDQVIRGQTTAVLTGLVPGNTYNVYPGVLRNPTAGNQVNNTNLTMVPL